MHVFIANTYIYIYIYLTNQPLSFGLLVFGDKPFSDWAVFVVLGKMLIPKGAYRPWNHFRLLVDKTLLFVVHK